jgi:hypothetical protein
MLDALYNGYPIVYSDTSTYIASGFELQTPIDRPITYGLFIRLTSFNGASLWPVIFFQSLILSHVIFLVLKQASTKKPFLIWGLIIVLFLSLFTGISWSSSQLIADIFTPIALLSLAVLLLGDIQKGTRIFLCVLYFVAISMHMSHILLFGLLLIGIYLLKKKLFKAGNIKIMQRRIVLLFALNLAVIFTMGSAISKSKDVFMMGAMVEQGIAKKYLDEYCGTKQYKLCAYKDSLPKTLNAFVWDTNGAFYKSGGWSSENRKEFNDIIFATYTKPKYIKLHIEASLFATLQQLVSFNIGDGNGKFSTGTLLFERIEKYAPGDIDRYSSSRQNKSEFLTISNWNKLYNIIILLSGVGLLLLLIIKRRKLQGQFNAMVFIFITAIVLNAWDTGTFSCVADRFGCKMMWLIPFMLVIAFKSICPASSLNDKRE